MRMSLLLFWRLTFFFKISVEIDELVVESILSSRFTVKCCLNSEVAGSIYQKVSLVTGIPIPNMVLYTRLASL